MGEQGEGGGHMRSISFALYVVANFFRVLHLLPTSMLGLLSWELVDMCVISRDDRSHLEVWGIHYYEVELSQQSPAASRPSCNYGKSRGGVE